MGDRGSAAGGRGGVPLWVWGAIVALAAIEPVTHGWVSYFPPQGAAPTGLHTVDTVFYRHSMRLFEADYASPFILCASEGGEAFPRFYYPLHFLYAVVGLVGRVLGFEEFFFLGLANGAGEFVYLLSIFLLLREVVPRYSERAFLLYTLGGGLGGVLYLGTGALGLHSSPRFEAYFFRYAYHELFAGTQLHPALLGAMLYYTVPLALCFASLLCLSVSLRTRSRARWILSLFLLFAGSFLNLRLGLPMWGIMLMWLYGRGRPLGEGVVRGALLGLAAVAGSAGGASLLWLNPMALQNQLADIRLAMWFSPFLSAVFFHLFTAPREVWIASRRLPRLGRTCAFGLVGYLGVFTALYAGYQAYYGNLFLCLDYHSALWACDRALVGLVLGAGYGLWRGPAAGLAEGEEEDPSSDWIALWLLVFAVVCLGTFGQGWYLRLTPNRLMPFLGLPICILSARGFERLGRRRPVRAGALLAVVIVCGVCSLLSFVLFFQGPLGRAPGAGPYAFAHYEVMSDADAACLASLGDGMVLTPLAEPFRFGDAISLRDTDNVVLGVGSLGLSRMPWQSLLERSKAFYAQGTAEELRRAQVAEYCIDYVYCPDTYPVDAAVVEEFRALPWLREVADSGRAVLFEVVR